MKPEHIISLISRWGGTMRFFPAGADERIGIAEEIASFASDLDQVKWLVGRLPKMYREWPGLHEVRALFCSKFRPRDGFEADSGVYLEGVPSENASVPQIAAPAVRYLPAPEEQPSCEWCEKGYPIDKEYKYSGVWHSNPHGKNHFECNAPMNAAIEKRMADLMAQMKARTQMPKPQVPLPSQADIEAIKAAQERNRKRHEALCDLARPEMAEGLYGRDGAEESRGEAGNGQGVKITEVA